MVSESNCQVTCSGNSSTICGGDSLLSYYSWDGPALYNWSFPVGIDAGQYSLLIGGVCIPLMTSQMITGKVTFVEKFGTGEPNSTGAYELDLSTTDNFTLAWRPMHVKTDVFCSAGLILPDIAGRQIDVGGVRRVFIDSLMGAQLLYSLCFCIIPISRRSLSRFQSISVPRNIYETNLVSRSGPLNQLTVFDSIGRMALRESGAQMIGRKTSMKCDFS